eukprot:5738217-Pyramimonas_sp.AAC.1
MADHGPKWTVGQEALPVRELLRIVLPSWFWPITLLRDTSTTSHFTSVNVPSLPQPPDPLSGATRYPLDGHSV